MEDGEKERRCEVRSKKPLFKRSEGTIEKVSDVFNFSSKKSVMYLTFHPSYPTFSSCLQIVNYHKVIPH
jgi:hypothetical protein